MITEESFVDFQCPYCEDSVAFPQSDVGLARACPNCTESLVVPAESGGQGHRLPVPITTPRLTLRRFSGSDWKDLLEFLSDEELFRYIDGRPLEEEEILHWLERDGPVKFTTPDQVYYLGIEIKETGKLVGYVGLTQNAPLQAMVHVVLGRAFQGQGIAREAVRGVLGFCFQGVKLHRVSAMCDSRHARGRHLLEKSGFRQEGEFIKDRLGIEGWQNTVWYAVLAEEWHP